MPPPTCIEIVAGVKARVLILEKVDADFVNLADSIKKAAELDERLSQSTKSCEHLDYVSATRLWLWCRRLTGRH